MPDTVSPFYGCEPYDAGPERYKVFHKDVLYHIEKNPSKYIGELYAFQGRVLQADESEDGIVFQVLTGDWAGSYRTGPSLVVSFGRSDTPIIKGSWVEILGRIGPQVEGQNAFGIPVSSLMMNAIAVGVGRTYYFHYYPKDEEIIEQWKSGELFSLYDISKPKVPKKGN